MSERLGAVEGTAHEFHAAAQLDAANEQVAAREAWIEWVDHDG